MTNLLPLNWVIIDAPSQLSLSRMNGSAARIMWVTLDGWVALTFANGDEAGKSWEIRAENLRQFCPVDEGGYWAGLWDECFKITNYNDVPKTKTIAPRPFIKWVGGKRQLLDILHASAPKNFNRYYEPFIGGGAFLFSQTPGSATISDINSELINCYQTIRDDVDALIDDLHTHINEESYFYSIRSMNVAEMTKVQRASRFIFLNKTCFNGLYRENKKGQFNTPYGRFKNPKIVDVENLFAVSEYLDDYDVMIKNGDYKTVLYDIQSDDFVYFDPPYIPMTKTANFANYAKGGFNLQDQIDLANMVIDLDKKGVKVMLSNSNTPIIHDLYKNFNIQIVHATRSVNCKSNKRGKEANEVLITNYQNDQ